MLYISHKDIAICISSYVQDFGTLKLFAYALREFFFLSYLSFQPLARFDEETELWLIAGCEVQKQVDRLLMRQYSRLRRAVCKLF